jgi:hypothetical protein
MRSVVPTLLSLVPSLTTLAACGKVQGGGVDAAPTIDADLSGDATVVTQAVLFGTPVGSKAANIDIISTLPNAKVFATGKTDAMGNATIKVVPGGAVTAIYKHPAPDMGAELISWVGVAPGDTLTFGSRQLSTAGVVGVALGTQSYSGPALATATFYSVYTSCSSAGTSAAPFTVTIPESSTCHVEPMDILFIANGPAGVVGYSYLPNRTFTNGAAVSITSWATPQNGSINMSGLPPEVASVGGTFRTVIDAKTPEFLTSYNGTPTGGAFSTTFPTPPTGDRTVGAASLGRPGFSSVQVLDSFSASNVTQTIAAPTLPPWMQGSATASSALREVNWFPVPTAASVSDGQIVRLNWSHQIGGTSYSHQWNLIVPPGRSTLALPEFPATFTDNTPQPQDFLGAFVRGFDISSVTGFDMLRTLSSATPMCLECALYAGDVQRVIVTP